MNSEITNEWKIDNLGKFLIPFPKSKHPSSISDENGYYNFYYGILLIITVEIPLAVVVISLLNKPNTKTAKKGAKLLKICTLGGLFSIYMGTI